jgi:uncharacterized membrane protein
MLQFRRRLDGTSEVQDRVRDDWFPRRLVLRPLSGPTRGQQAWHLKKCRYSSTVLIHDTREISMSDLVVIVYPSEAKAEEVRQRLLSLQKDYLITINDAVIAVKGADGNVKLNQLVNTTAIGAASGSFWGLLVGLVFLNPLIGVAVGAASGALGGALSDFGINDSFMKQLSGKIDAGSAALFLLIKNMTADKVLREIKDSGGTVLQTSLDDTKEQKLRDILAKAAASAPPTTSAGFG